MEYEKLTDYKLHWFDATDQEGKAIYHTNVMLSVGKRFAVVCLESIHNQHEREQLITVLEECGKQIIDVTYEQMENFACNILELVDQLNAPVYAMSKRAWSAFTPEQQNQISQYATLALGEIDIIEDLGGGGARCMLAEINLQKK